MSELYYQNGYLTQTNATVISAFDEEGHNCVKFDNNLFYPQGGGQKGDRGEIIISGIVYKIINTIKDPYGTGSLCITDKLIPESFIGKEANCKLNWEHRYGQMKLHTCVHLHHCMIEKVVGDHLDNPKVSSIEDGFAFNKYPKDFINGDIVEEANKLFLGLLGQDIAVLTYPDLSKENFRWWECLGYKIPCGGVHILNLQEINHVNITSSTKKGFLTIKFTL